MTATDATPDPLLSKRQRRMLQDMGIDVFTSRRMLPVTEEHVAKSSDSPVAQARAALGRSQAQTETHRPADALVTTPVQSLPTPVEAAESSSAQGISIDLFVVATPGVIFVSESAASAQELRFLQDLANAVYWANTRIVLKEKVRNSEFRWPIVEATGTPKRAVAVFLQKHKMLASTTAVIITPTAKSILEPWVSENIAHWNELEGLGVVMAKGEAKRRFWSRVLGLFGHS